MSYYDTIAYDLARAKEILKEGKNNLDPDTGIFDGGGKLLVAGGGNIWGKDIYAAYKLLESFVAEIEALMRENHQLRCEKREQFQMLTLIRELADGATGIDRSQNDERAPGALGAVQHLIAAFERRKA